MDGYTKYYMCLGSLPCWGQGGPIEDPKMPEMVKCEGILISAKNKQKKMNKMRKLMKQDVFWV